MDEQLKKVLLDAAQKGINGVENTINWVTEQAPELLEQLVLYNLITSGIWTIVGAIMIGFSIWFFKKYIFIEDYDGGPQVLAPVFCTLFGLLAFTFNIDTFIKCAFAPKLFIFEYLAKLIQ